MTSLKNDILFILSAMPETRKDDNKLFAEVIKLRMARYGKDDKKMLNVAEVFSNAHKYSLPCYTTLIRERRELQIMFPVLQDEATTDRRAEAEADFRERYGRKTE